MKLVTYNINGIRSASSKGLLNWIAELDADILCFQEVRANEKITSDILNISNQINMFAPTLCLNKYHAILNCGTVAGYAGTLILTKTKPNKVVFGINGQPDPEGRTITAFFNNFAIVNCYIPNGTKRLPFKMDFYLQITNYLTELSKTTNVIFFSDANVAHTPQDLSHPKECANRTGYLPIEREAFTNLLNKGFCDVARKFNGSNQLYTWRSYRSRMEEFGPNYGWKYRFDYILCNTKLQNNFTAVSIPDLPYSDHLPIIAAFNI